MNFTTSFLSFFCIGLLLSFLLSSCDSEAPSNPKAGLLQIRSARIGTLPLSTLQVVENAPADKGMVITFSDPIQQNIAEENIKLYKRPDSLIAIEFAYLDNDATLSVQPVQDLENFTNYALIIGNISSVNNKEFPGVEFSFITEQGEMNLISAFVDEQTLLTDNRVDNVSLYPKITLNFDQPIDPETDLNQLIKITRGGEILPYHITFSENNQTIQLSSAAQAVGFSKYNLFVSTNLKSENGFPFAGLIKSFYTQLDSTFKFDEISDEALLTLVQKQTFSYFYDFAHPGSGLARERNTSGDVVTIGGSGFGVMAIMVGIERGFITRAEGVARWKKIVDFLETADRFHGVWPHWMNGNTGNTIPFSATDDGADLVETAFMIQGLLTVRQYLNADDAAELDIINKITALWEEVEWDWFVQDGEQVLTWHWSPNVGFQLDLPIRGWNEALIIYVLAASSPTFAIDKAVYDQGWARGGGIVNGTSAYGIQMPLGESLGGPLFFAHYSFLGLDPRNLQDQYANYWQQNTAHSLINRAYCIDNPGNYLGYSENSWGLTASDNHVGYSAHSPYNDLGVITPTAALSSMPYTPQESLEALKTFYYLLGDRLWGEYGFYDAFNVTQGWYANAYLAIDQGPIVIMIENYRTGLLWDYFMQNEEVKSGLNKLDFTY